MRNAHYRTGNMARNTENRGVKKQSVGHARWGETLVNLEKRETHTLGPRIL